MVIEDAYHAWPLAMRTSARVRDSVANLANHAHATGLSGLSDSLCMALTSVVHGRSSIRAYAMRNGSTD